MARPPSRQPPAAPPATAKEAATHVRAFMVRLFDREDGEAADWKLIAETLFRAAFDALDKLPDDACRSVARRAHERSYGRMVNGPKADSAASNSLAAKAENAPSNTAV